MAYEDNPYRDEDGEPLMDYDDFGAGRDPSPEPHQDDVLEDNDDWPDQDRSRTPVHEDPSSLKSKPRKRLIKKSQVGKLPVISDLDDDDGGDGDEGNRKRLKKEKRHKGEKKGSKYPRRSSSDKAATDGEVKEMWETIAGGDSEDDQEGVRNYDDDNFIDDTGVHPSDRYGSDNEPRSPSHHPQAEEGEEDDEIKDMFKMGKKRKKNEKSPAEVAFLVEKVMAELEVTAEEDADLNRQGKPAINKLKKLPLLTDVLSKKQLQQEFLDHGVLTLLKNWLEPLPDGSLPNINIRAAILQILTDVYTSVAIVVLESL